jgi:hypothetical protein
MYTSLNKTKISEYKKENKMTERLIQRTSANHPEDFVSLPTTRDEAWQASANRVEVANIAHDSASIVNKFLGESRKPVRVELGKSKEGKQVTGVVSKVNPESRMLRIKILEDGHPEASFAYGGLYSKKGDKFTYHVTEEKPDASGRSVQEIKRGVESVRSLGLDHVDHGVVYHGRDTVEDQGAMDFALTAEILTIAAHQIENPEAKAA